MELTKQPQTPMEYWRTIESLGGFAWQMSHRMANGHLEDPLGNVSKDVARARETQRRLVADLKEKFGVIPPDECPRVEFGQHPAPAPEGKIYYWDWYEKMKKESYRQEYEGLICSACPLSEGLEYMVSTGWVPCGPWSGFINSLSRPYACAMTDNGGWSRQKLEQEILAEGGEVALVAFKAKETALRLAEEENSAKTAE